ncbi:MAG: PmoA family protein [Kiritimatiellae bacterium]|nr:PmoA family protein [Kiritimatiellia bacterium]
MKNSIGYVWASMALILLGAVTAPGSVCAEMKIAETKDLITISANDKPILEYRQRCNPNKVYVSKLYTPLGLQVLLDSPADHIHHHGLMYALDSDKDTWWLDGKTTGIQAPAAKTETKKQDDSAIISQSLNWDTATGKTILKETRVITLHTGEDISYTLLSWHTVLSAASNDPVPLITDRHYAGLGIRFVREMDKKGEFIFADVDNMTTVRGTERVTSCRWCAYVADVGGKPVTVAMFSAPSTFRHPTYWFTMTKPFAYISATLNLFRDPHILKPGSPLNLTYGIAVFDGKQDNPTIEKIYQRWLKIKH